MEGGRRLGTPFSFRFLSLPSLLLLFSLGSHRGWDRSIGHLGERKTSGVGVGNSTPGKGQMTLRKGSQTRVYTLSTVPRTPRPRDPCLRDNTRRNFWTPRQSKYTRREQVDLGLRSSACFLSRPWDQDPSDDRTPDRWTDRNKRKDRILRASTQGVVPYPLSPPPDSPVLWWPNPGVPTVVVSVKPPTSCDTLPTPTSTSTVSQSPVVPNAHSFPYHIRPRCERRSSATSPESPGPVGTLGDRYRPSPSHICTDIDSDP